MLGTPYWFVRRVLRSLYCHLLGARLARLTVGRYALPRDARPDEHYRHMGGRYTRVMTPREALAFRDRRDQP